MTRENEILEQLKLKVKQTLPQGAKLLLFGSRARGDASAESDWDFLLLLVKPELQGDDYNKYVYPIVRTGWNLGEYFSVKTYTTQEWLSRKGTPFYKNVEREGIAV